MRTKSVLFIIITMMATMSISSFVSGKILFKDNFEDDRIGQRPKNWAVGFEGKDDAEVIQDPERGGNKVFSSPTERHDVAGAIYITGKGENWTDYYVLGASWCCPLPRPLARYSVHQYFLESAY